MPSTDTQYRAKIILIRIDGKCWIWTGCLIHGTGYPMATAKGKQILITRIVLETKLRRPLKPKMKACHTCDVRACVNPDHLWEGTHKQNMEDMVRKGRSKGLKGPLWSEERKRKWSAIMKLWWQKRLGD